MYNQVIWSVNGTLRAGTKGLSTAFFINESLPSSEMPNNLIAPFWADLNLGQGGEWYTTVLTTGSRDFTVFEWNDVPLYFDTAKRYTFQVWIENGESGNIWFVYHQLTDVNANSGSTVGLENDRSSLGSSYYFLV